MRCSISTSLSKRVHEPDWPDERLSYSPEGVDHSRVIGLRAYAPARANRKYADSLPGFAKVMSKGFAKHPLLAISQVLIRLVLPSR